ncbi:MAG: signal recognition particle-docking protein FtsY [Halobacteriovoraceae bacterium]|jgi:fused signal recognition particle receptor|nr:signal recognition particle-docking protein FtsY [Halobacteriovoraceae bacterium]MBT5092647.1 signal recognition particle-docking protein FtsY [Halobacteriovoraceae bacterium]
MQMIQALYDLLGVQAGPNGGDLAGLLSLSFLAIVSLGRAFFSSGSSAGPKALGDVTVEKIQPIAPESVELEERTPPSVVEKGPSFRERLKRGLDRSRQQVWGRIGTLISGGKLDTEALEELEEILYGADIGPQTVAELTEELQKRAAEGNFEADEFKSFLFTFLESKMKTVQQAVSPELYQYNARATTPKVIMVVGVNGAGKTTTIGKLATKLTRQGAKVVVGACDTFRAAAVDQLQVWCDRAGAEMIRAKEGANPSGVGFEALQAAKNSNADYCILDTAGRLHTSGNLMDELKKSKAVLAKLDDSAPHEVLLVIDAITGQNALRQAEEFHKTLELTGLVFTKCDGSSKAGSAIAIVQKLKVPIAYIGVGESVEDLDIFSLEDYLGALLDYQKPLSN